VFYGDKAPPLVSLSDSTLSQTGEGTKTLTVSLSEESRESAVVPFTFAGTLTEGADYTITGTGWDNTAKELTIPAGTTSAQLDVAFTNVSGTAQLQLAAPADNTQVNLMTFSNYVPEGGTRVNTMEVESDGVTLDNRKRNTDDGDLIETNPTDWIFGCDDFALGFSSLSETVEDVTLPDGTTGPCLFAGPRSAGADGGAGAYGCIRKSYGAAVLGGYDYAGTLGDVGGGILRNVEFPQAGLRTGHCIWSVYVKCADAPAGFSLAPYTTINLLNRSKQASVSDDPNDKNHEMTVQWTAGVPSFYEEDGTDHYNIESVGNGWYRLSVVYNAPAEADGDTTNFFVRPCNHPSDDVDQHYLEGVWVWGAQFELDPTETQTTPSAYQEFIEETWFAGTCTLGSTTQTEVTVVGS
jgi:hypothetical protein